VSRRALIITNPGETEDRRVKRYCEGVYRDVVLYSNFLKSPVGGLWEPGEIRHLDRPDVSALEAELDRLKRVDYSFIVYSGHGYHSGRSTILALKRGVDIDSLKLRRGAPKHTLILDCCRVIERPTLLSEQIAKAMKSRPFLDYLRCRNYYDQLIKDCPTGLVVLFGCSINQTAGDDGGSGGYYSASLIEATEEWVASKAGGLHMRMSLDNLSVLDAHLRAVPKVAALSGDRQLPRAEGSRTGPYFPLCVVA
jgi:Caspase domain